MSSDQLAVRLGRRLRGHRIRTYISQEDLADRAGLHRTEISLLERGGRVPRVDTLLRLAAALDVEPEELLRGIRVQLPERVYISAETLTPKDREASIEGGLLTVVCDLHPEHLNADDLLIRVRAANPHSMEKQAIEQGLEGLKDAGLLREIDGRIAPTRAALHFHRLPSR